MDNPLRIAEYGEIILESGQEILGNGGTQYIDVLEDVRDVGLSALARVWAKQHETKVTRGVVTPEIDDGPDLRAMPLEELLISLLHSEEFDRKNSPASPISLVLTHDARFAVSLWVVVRGQATAEAVIRLLQPQMERNRAQLLRVEVIETLDETVFTLTIEYTTRGRTVGRACTSRVSTCGPNPAGTRWLPILAVATCNAHQDLNLRARSSCRFRHRLCPRTA